MAIVYPDPTPIAVPVTFQYSAPAIRFQVGPIPSGLTFYGGTLTIDGRFGDATEAVGPILIAGVLVGELPVFTSTGPFSVSFDLALTPAVLAALTAAGGETLTNPSANYMINWSPNEDLTSVTLTLYAEEPCTYEASPTSASYDADGGAGSFSVVTEAPCSWTAVSASDWLTVTGEASGTGDGTVTYQVAAYAGCPTRTVVITVGDGINSATFTVAQTGCSCAIAPSTASFPKEGGSGTVNLTTFAQCGWTAAPLDDWIEVASVSGTGDGTIEYSVAQNGPGAAPRTGAIVLGACSPQTLEISQDGWPVAVVAEAEERPEADCMGHSQFFRITWPWGYAAANLTGLVGEFATSFDSARVLGPYLATVGGDNMLRVTGRDGAEVALETAVPDCQVWRYRYGSGG